MLSQCEGILSLYSTKIMTKYGCYQLQLFMNGNRLNKVAFLIFRWHPSQIDAGKNINLQSWDDSGDIAHVYEEKDSN